MCEASRPLFCALCFFCTLYFFYALRPPFTARIGLAQIHGGYNDHFQGGLLGLSLGW